MESFTHWELWKMFICCTKAKQDAINAVSWYRSVGKGGQFEHFTQEVRKYGQLCDKLQTRIDHIRTTNTKERL